MRKTIGVLLLLGTFTGCSDNSVTMVKKGTLEIDKSLTVGQAIDNYKYFKKTKWEVLTTDNGKKVVQAYGEIDLEKHPKINAKVNPTLKQAEMRFQFVINQDNSFQLGWCGLAAETTDKGKIEPDQNVNLTLCVGSLKAIYENSPNI